jgi:hypothetical protein
MTQNVNQFGMSLEKGLLTLSKDNLFDVKVDDASTATLVNGAAVKITDTTDSQITVDIATATTDPIFGFVVYESRKNAHVAGDLIRIACIGSVMQMEASAAITRGATVQIVPTGEKVVTRSTGTVIGRALDKAAADGDLIRVLISTL